MSISIEAYKKAVRNSPAGEELTERGIRELAAKWMKDGRELSTPVVVQPLREELEEACLSSGAGGLWRGRLKTPQGKGMIADGPGEGEDGMYSQMRTRDERGS